MEALGSMSLNLILTQVRKQKLYLHKPDPSLSGYKYRVLLTIPSYVCGVVPLNYEGNLIVYPDNDEDGVS